MNYFTYDIAGNMTTDGEGDHITYNAFNQITHVITSVGQQSCYIYDGSGKEVFEKNDLGTTYLFHRDKKLINEQINTYGQATHIAGYQYLAKTMDSRIYQYYENNYKGDMISILEKSSANNHYQLKQRNIYSPYGMCWHSLSVSQPLYQQNLIGFDGKRTDPATGWQFLGAGHRTYNPAMRYFVSEDPAGDGYAFGNNNPVMNTDPGGNISRTVNKIFKIIGYISSLGMRAIPQRWGAIVGTVVSTGLMAACGGALNVTLPVLLMNGTFSVVPVAAVIVPSNRGLNIAASVVGAMQFVTVIAGSCLGLFNAVYSACCDAATTAVSTENSIAMEELSIGKLESISAITNHSPSFDSIHSSDYSDQNIFDVMANNIRTLKQQLNQRMPYFVVNNNPRPYLDIRTIGAIKEVNDSLVDIYGPEAVTKEIQVLLFESYQQKKPLFIDTLSMALNNTTVKDISGASNYMSGAGQPLIPAIKVTKMSVSLPDLSAQTEDVAIIEHQRSLTFLEQSENNLWTTVEFTSDKYVYSRSGSSLSEVFQDDLQDYVPVP
ncbi:MAG: RHS repeat-associated core domain-containing protein [Endozoicomonadaceae bacterium]|nr:RHS repeat-associated core domain-containing protein [Endozoicomonadaceae bacterium]